MAKLLWDSSTGKLQFENRGNALLVDTAGTACCCEKCIGSDHCTHSPNICGRTVPPVTPTCNFDISGSVVVPTTSFDTGWSTTFSKIASVSLPFYSADGHSFLGAYGYSAGGFTFGFSFFYALDSSGSSGYFSLDCITQLIVTVTNPAKFSIKDAVLVLGLSKSLSTKDHDMYTNGNIVEFLDTPTVFTATNIDYNCNCPKGADFLFDGTAKATGTSTRYHYTLDANFSLITGVGGCP